VAVWHPHQLRHATGTLIGSRYGLENARAVLGHDDMDSTLIYVQRDHDAARRVAREVG
jgi:site-specific recombinase XerC